ncbi:MAG: hypothetical protein KatS3mg102_2658 [Planctomycetota bacterium]|nr:MAG: hypothetical protein KatS3mg102_2658 [Planctomycetota bacterium]
MERTRRAWSAAVLAVSVAASAGCAGAPPAPVPPPPPPPALGPPAELPEISLEPEADYLLGSDDVLLIHVYELERPGHTSVLELAIDPRGRVFIPLLGELVAAGKTAAQLRQELVQRLGERLLVEPQVQVAVKEYRARRITVSGLVRRPGVYAVGRQQLTVLEALALAGGLAPEAGRWVLVVHRDAAGRQQTRRLDLEQLLAGQGLGPDALLEAGDLVHVPEQERVYVLGYVARPGPVPLHAGATAGQAVAMAGGPLPRLASPSAAFIRRVHPEGRTELIPLDLTEVAAGSAPDVEVRPGDWVVVPQTGWRAFALEAWDFVKGRIGGIGFGTIRP